MIDQREPTLEELLNEPIIRQVMRSDGVRAEDVQRLMEAIHTRPRRSRAPLAPMALHTFPHPPANLCLCVSA